MSVYRRGGVWWYKFSFNGQPIRDSAKTPSKTVARAAEQARRRELELGVNRIPRRERMPLFPQAAEVWLAGKTGLVPRTKERYAQCIVALKADFGRRLVCDIDDRDICEFQRRRKAAGAANRTVNYEVGTLRGILKKYRLWGPIADGIRMLRENQNVGRSISAEDERKLIGSASKSRSTALLPLFVLSIDTGLRFSEVQALRHRDAQLMWKDGIISSGEILVGKSKTPAGQGRLIPLTRRVCACLTLWITQFEHAEIDSYLFPRHKVGLAGDSRVPKMWEIDVSRPMGSWRKAWRLACAAAGVRYRWHDLRHSFISRLLENPNVSEDTAKSLAGHVSRRMLEHYSHVRSAAKQSAIRFLDEHVETEATRVIATRTEKGTKMGTIKTLESAKHNSSL